MTIGTVELVADRVRQQSLEVRSLQDAPPESSPEAAVMVLRSASFSLLCQTEDLQCTIPGVFSAWRPVPASHPFTVQDR